LLSAILFTFGIVALVLLVLVGAHHSQRNIAAARDGDVPAYREPRHYLCYRAGQPVEIDGRLDKDVWQSAPWTEDFVDIQGETYPGPRFRTRAKMLWDDDYFYVGAELEEPHVWASFTEHDSYIFTRDPDFEVFIDPNGGSDSYYEFEINALNTSWDLLLTRPYKDGGMPIDSWNIPGLKTAVHVDGTLNDPSDIDHGWTIEMAFPWKVLGELVDKRKPPGNGEQWRVNFSRVEWAFDIVNGRYRRKPNTAEDNWVWSPQGIIDMHRPETWGYVQFTTDRPGEGVFRPDPAAKTKYLLHVVYYREQVYRREHGRWAGTLKELDVDELPCQEPDILRMNLETTSSLFQANAVLRLPNGQTETWHIRQDAYTWKDP
jgi:hypothetical protein